MVGLPRRRGDRTSCGHHRTEFSARDLTSWARNVYTLMSSPAACAARSAAVWVFLSFDLRDAGFCRRPRAVCARGRRRFFRREAFGWDGGARGPERGVRGGSRAFTQRAGPGPPGRARAERGTARPPAWNDTDRGRGCWPGGPERSRAPGPTR